MPKPKATVIEETAITRIEPFPAIPTELHLPDVPSWDRARGLVNEVRQSISAVVQLGFEIRALHSQFFAQGKRTDALGREVKASANIAKGWQQKVQDELNISHVTALKIMERAESLICMRRIELGESVEYLDSRTNEQRLLEPTPDLQEQAAKAIEAVAAGTVAAPRAWAGLIGESSRRASQGGSSSRAATDHAYNIRTAIIKLRTSLHAWKHIGMRDRMELEFLWKEVAAKLPDTWTIE